MQEMVSREDQECKGRRDASDDASPVPVADPSTSLADTSALSPVLTPPAAAQKDDGGGGSSGGSGSSSCSDNALDVAVSDTVSVDHDHHRHQQPDDDVDAGKATGEITENQSDEARREG